MANSILFILNYYLNFLKNSYIPFQNEHSNYLANARTIIADTHSNKTNFFSNNLTTTLATALTKKIEKMDEISFGFSLKTKRQ